ncbi:hypothetical protein [Luteibacter sp. 3190]|uniref:hypothetical protein n=1 Tax=Luteibacter sp. 3190 TaxID=2817736 RepID=UPI002854ABA1|nr:hypothetical protein [Luteibacter sp. 3190]MDR6935359.1 hypothetical protein [Luteibacter sp. 3190]
MEAPVLIDIINRAGGQVNIDYIGELRQLHALPPPMPFGAVCRPLIAGSSVSHIQGNAGTIGLFPLAADRTRRVLLSNNHVLARNNAAQLGDPIVQPATADGGSIQYQVGALERFEPIEVPGPNAIDAAIASLHDRLGPPNLLIAGQRAVRGIRSARAGEPIWKFGKSTAGTKGRVGVSLVDNVRVQVAGRGEALFHRVIEIRGTNGPFGTFGDSGAAVMGTDDFAIGLLFAGSHTKNVTYACDLPTVFRKLGLPLDIPYDQP